MIEKIKLLVVVLLLIGCSQNKKVDTQNEKEIKVGTLKMLIPSSFTFSKGSGIDSYVAYLITEKKDTFHIEYGEPGIIYSLFDVPPKALSIENKEQFQKFFGKLPSSDGAVFSKSPEEDNLQNIFQENFYLYDTINGLVVKIVQPKKIGQGKTGMYIPELRDSSSLSIYANNLDSTTHRVALQMFKTIRYK